MEDSGPHFLSTSICLLILYYRIFLKKLLTDFLLPCHNRGTVATVAQKPGKTVKKRDQTSVVRTMMLQYIP